MESLKFVRHPNGTTFLLFPDSFTHAVIWRRYFCGIEPKSAGFWYLEGGEFVCYGHSASLGVFAAEDGSDTRVLNNYLAESEVFRETVSYLDYTLIHVATGGSVLMVER